ncbi:DUF4246 domain-containing protein [Streptomyces althioticus]|uniref:DUF4246 domain-containing protein n=1 Tax=Streptomyces althioticus TaxID=83380 RepID=UPI00374D4C35
MASRVTMSATPRTLREIEMTQCSAQLRAKPRWFEKMRDAGIVGRRAGATRMSSGPRQSRTKASAEVRSERSRGAVRTGPAQSRWRAHAGAVRRSPADVWRR